MERLIKKVNKMGGTTYFEDTDGDIVSKKCGKCDEFKELDKFPKKKKGLGGRASRCKECIKLYNQQYRQNNKERMNAQCQEYYQANKEMVNKQNRIWYKENTDKVRRNQKKYYENNKEKLIEYSLQWNQNNPDKVARYSRNFYQNNLEKMSLNRQLRRARIANLPDTLTEDEWCITLEYFDNACALTGNTDNITLDHVIPISTEQGGTTFENSIPLNFSINASKNDRNLFDWFKVHSERLELSQGKFDRLIKYIASMNDMTVEEYREYYDRCFVEEVEIV